MKKNKWLLTFFCLLMCFGLVYSASAASDLTAKQLILDRIQNSESIPQGEINKTATGSAEYQVTTLRGMAVSMAEELKIIEGALLRLNYKLDSPEKKLEAKYDLTLNNNTYNGSVYLDNGKYIFSTDILSLIKTFDPEFGKGQSIPPYVYMSDENIANIWDSLNKGQYLTPEIKDILVFFFEAIPDKYFTISLTNQKVSFELDQDGLEDVAASVMQKIANEKERFATLVTNYLTASGAQAEDIAKMKSDILEGIEKSIKDGSYPDSPEKIRELLDGMLVLEEFKSEASLLPGGQSNTTATVNIGGDSDFKGKLVFNSSSTGSKEELNGTYSLTLTASESTQKMNINGELLGDIYQTGVEAKSNCAIKVNAKDFEGNINYLDLAINGKSEAKADPDVQVNIPVLTEANSADLEKVIKNTPRVVLDGKTITFDADPYVVNLKDGKRVMVPLRNLAEALGCEVSWTSPDQINIVRGDTVINMYINKRTYYVNGEEKQLDATPFIREKRTMVPLRFVAEELGCAVQYNDAENTVYIYSQ